LIQIFTQAVFEQGDIDHAIPFGHSNAFTEGADRLRRVAASPQPRERWHARIVPTADMALGDQLQQLALTQHSVADVEARKLDLLRMTRRLQLIEEPVV